MAAQYHLVSEFNISFKLKPEFQNKVLEQFQGSITKGLKIK